MVPAGGAIGHVGAWTLEDEADEANAVCDWIRRLLDDGISPGWGHAGEDLRVAPEQVCVLARTRYALDPVRAKLDEAGIDAVLRTSEGGLFDSDLGQAVYFLVRASCNPMDVPAIRKASEHLGTLLPGVASVAQFDELVSAMGATGSAKQMRDLAGAVAGLADGTGSIRQLIAVQESIIEPYGDPQQDAAWAGDCAELAALWRQFEIRTRDSERTVPAFVQWM